MSVSRFGYRALIQCLNQIPRASRTAIYRGSHGCHYRTQPFSRPFIVTIHQRSFCSTGSIKDVAVPQLAESLSEGDLKWDKAVGDTVSQDEVIGAVETDKTSVPIHSPVSGVITEMLAEDGETVKPGQMILKIQVGEGSVAETEPVAEAQATPQPTQQQQQQQETTTTQSSEPPIVQPIDHTPKSTIPVSQIKSEIAQTMSNNEQQSSGTSRTVSQVKMNRMRLKIASRLKEAQNTYAMLTTFNEIDMSNMIDMRLKYKDAFVKKHSVKLGFMSAFVKASTYALLDQPVVNAVIDGNQILYRDFIDISVAVATPKGLVVPVLRNVNSMNFADIEKNINALGEKARNNTLSVEDMEGGTFTISNGGVFGSLFGTPIINSPQSAILGMHAINDKPTAVNGEVKIRPIMVVALTYDHRLIDGREAVTFLKKIKEVIEDPRIILLDL